MNRLKPGVSSDLISSVGQKRYFLYKVTMYYFWEHVNIFNSVSYTLLGNGNRQFMFLLEKA